MDFIDAIRGILNRFEWVGLIEIVLIGAAVFATMRFLQGTRGARLLRGFLFLLMGTTVVLYLIADFLDLERLRVLAPIFILSLFLIALVAFQPELRRALIRLGATTWFVESAREVERNIEATVEACAYLSKNKIGGLIAFERTTELGAMVESGCVLDAEISKELLTTLFWPGSALHDMGVIISQDRLAAAAVQFPLTESGELDASLGSRHRAAVGLSQEADTVVVVVSEEDGTISVAMQGQLKRKYTPETLRQLLKAELINPTTTAEQKAAAGSSIPKRKYNVRAAAQSSTIVVLITALIWIAADLNVSEQRDISIPIRVVAASGEEPSRYVAIAQPPYQTDLLATLSGRRINLDKFEDKIGAEQFLKVRIDKSTESSAEPQQIGSLNLLKQIKAIKDLKLSIISAKAPLEIPVLVSDYVTLDNIKVEANFGDLLVVAEVIPPTVSTRLPRFAANLLKANPIATADAEQRIRAATKHNNTFDKVKVPLTFPALQGLNADMRIEINPSDEVSISGQIEALTETVRKGPIQITWSLPPLVQKRFTVELAPGQDTRPDIDITGPKGQVQQFDRSEIRGLVDVTAADAEQPNKDITRTVRFIILQPGFSIAADQRPHQITFRLVPRPDTATPGN